MMPVVQKKRRSENSIPDRGTRRFKTTKPAPHAQAHVFQENAVTSSDDSSADGSHGFEDEIY
jgi:hypothetical protein